MSGPRSACVAGLLLVLSVCSSYAWADTINEPTNSPGRLPKDEAGRSLNLNFETGDLTDWTATGTAWQQQPIKGEIDPKRPAAGNKRSLLTGAFWIGGFERLGDQPQGTLSSVPFLVDAPWCAFLLGGGSHQQTRVELVTADDNKVIASERGYNEEEMHPVVVNLQQQQGKKIFIRIVDEHSGGWGHVNFDDFRFYDIKPEFKDLRRRPVAAASSNPDVKPVELYPYQNLTGEEAARLMKVPPGFKVQCAAQEPEVKQPIAMALDDRGRVWIAEAYEYPQRGAPGKGRDRILIFEDTNLDGTLDKRTVFVEQLNLISGLEVGFGGVWVGAAPYLMFIPDRNGNDIPDGLEPGANPSAAQNVPFPEDVPSGAEVLLDGFAWQDTHETLNAFAWGPDGWLYGCHGVFTHSNVGPPGAGDAERTRINAGIWRYHPTRRTFEVFSEGTSNPWGIDWNREGDLFCTACVIPHLYYLAPGGRYQRQAGQHFNPFTYDDIKTIARHRHYVGNQWNVDDRRASDDLGGGHAHAGAMIYQGGAWPSEYEGKLFMHNIHGNRVNVDVLLPEGSGYAGDRNPDFLLTGDKWSQMINLQTGPDGQVWMIDWYDQQQCHRKEEEVHDRSNGRIYRVSYGNAKPARVDLQKQSSAELIHLAITAENDWFARHARRILQERSVQSQENWLQLIAAEPVSASQALRKLWLLNAVGEFDRLGAAEREAFLSHEDPHVRGWCVRLLVEFAPASGPSREILSRLTRLAAEDPSPVVRLALAGAAQHLPLSERWGLLERLVAHPEDARDPNLPLLYWYALEPLADADPHRALALGMTAGETIPVLREYMIRRLGSGKLEETLPLLVAGLGQAQNDSARLTFLKGIRGALVGIQSVQPPAQWAALYPALTQAAGQSLNFDVYVYALGLGARFGDTEGMESLRRIVLDEAGPPDQRRTAFSFLTENRDPQLAQTVGQLLSGASLRAEALKAAAMLENPQLASAIIGAYKTLSPLEQLDARNALASRALYATALLKAVEGNQIPKADLSADIIRQLQNLNSDQVNQLLQKVWGMVRESDGDRKAQIARLTRLIEDPHGPPADREAGRALFAKTCQQCHTLFGIGGKVGPDITGSNRGNLNYLLSNIVDPSAVMAKEYQPVVIATTDGRVVTGIVKEESTSALTVQTTNELVTIGHSDIEARRQSDQSMMPDGLLKNLSPREVRSLAAYLSGPGQVFLQATPETAPRFFNGTDLSGWRPSREEDAGLWSVEGGELIGRSAGLDHNAFLVSELSFEDFRFSCEVKLAGNQGNSGIQFRSRPLEDGEVRGYQADIGPGWWGKLYEERGRGLLIDQDFSQLVHPGDWNRYEIIAVGGRVQTFLNGQKVVDLNDPPGARGGVFALQLHSGGPMDVRFRHLQVEVLRPLPEFAAHGTPAGRWPVSIAGSESTRISWKKTTLDTLFRSEGCCLGDFDNDGDLDIATGSVWYEHPDPGSADNHWKQHPILEAAREFNPVGYSDTFMNFAEDLNQDGWLDLIVVGFPGTPTAWFENPGRTDSAAPPAVWKRHTMIEVTNNESPQYLDLDGDGRRELLCGVENQVMAYAGPQSYPQSPWKIVPISPSGVPGTDKFSHGLGGGDVNGDGRADVLITNGWWEQPEQLTATPWKFHPAALGQPCSQMFVYDFDGDGDADVLSASAHRFGIWWHEQAPSQDPAASPESRWTQHQIDDSISQTHAVVQADINGDGLPDFVTGRRHWAHNGHDPGEDQPAVLCWFELSRVDGRPAWTKHQIDDNSGVGTQFEVADVNGDGYLDIVTSNKKGTFLLEQVREETSAK